MDSDRSQGVRGLENNEDWGGGNSFSIPPPPSHISCPIAHVKFVCVKLSCS